MKDIVDLLMEAYDAGIDFADDEGGIQKEHQHYKACRAATLSPLVERLTKILDPFIWSGG